MDLLRSSQEFLDYLLSCFYCDLRTAQLDNYDWDRFSSDGIDRSDIPYDELHIAMMKALTKKTESLFRVYELLTDPASKNLYIELIRYKLAGHKHVRLSRNDASYAETIRLGKNWPAQEIGMRKLMGSEVSLKAYNIDFEGRSLKLQALQVLWPYLFRQYYFERDGIRISPEQGDHVIDAGASLGDTALAFGASTGAAGMIYIFELIDAHLQVCRDNLKMNEGLSRFKIFNCGLSDQVKAAAAQSPASKATDFDFGFELDANDGRFAMETLDNLVKTQQVERVDFIKMDIEGSELRALQGAENCLKIFKPKLAISLYHKVEDFFEIPLYLDGLGLGYRFYLDHYTIHAGETVLYATVV